MLEFEEYKAKLNARKGALEDLGQALRLEEAEREIAELETEHAPSARRLMEAFHSGLWR